MGPDPRMRTFLLSAGLQLAFRIVGRVVVGGLGRELGSAGIHHLVGGNDARGEPHIGYLLPGLSHELGDALVGESHALGLLKRGRAEARSHLVLHGNDVLNPVEEVGLNGSQPERSPLTDIPRPRAW